MTRDEFLNFIFDFFKIKDENGILKKSYDMALSSPMRIDWQKLYLHVLKNVESRYLPPPKWFVSKMKNYEIITADMNDGKKLRVLHQSGKITEYVILTGFMNNVVKIKNYFKNYDEIIEIKMYDKDVSFIGAKVFPEKAKGEIIYKKE